MKRITKGYTHLIAAVGRNFTSARAPQFRLATFATEVTVSLGHALIVGGVLVESQFLRVAQNYRPIGPVKILPHRVRRRGPRFCQQTHSCGLHPINLI